MILKKRGGYGCCTGKRVNGFRGFRGFGAVINDFDTFYVAAVGAKSYDDMLLVVSEYFCGGFARRYDGSTEAVMVQALQAGDLTTQASWFVNAWSALAAGNSTHVRSSCAGAAGTTVGGSAGSTLDQIIAIGKQASGDVSKITGSTGPASTPGTTNTTTAKTATKMNTSMMVGLGAAAIAGFLLLMPKKKG